MPKQPDQADGGIPEDQLINFLVNTLTDAFGLILGENADLALEDITRSSSITSTSRSERSKLIVNSTTVSVSR